MNDTFISNKKEERGKKGDAFDNFVSFRHTRYFSIQKRTAKFSLLTNKLIINSRPLRETSFEIISREVKRERVKSSVYFFSCTTDNLVPLLS